MAPPSEWRYKWRHLPNEQRTISNKSKLQKNCKFPKFRNIRRRQWRPLANVVASHRCYVVVSLCFKNFPTQKTPMFFQGPATRITLNIHSKLNFHLQINCSSAFQHLSMLFLICKNTSGPKRPPTNLVIYTRRTLTKITAPYNIPTKISTNLVFSTPKWRICAWTQTLERHYTTDDNVVQRTCSLLSHWLATVTTSRASCLDVRTELIIRDVPFRKFITE